MRNFTKFLALGLVFLSFQSSTIAQNLGIPDGVFYVSGPFTTNRLESHLSVENTTNNSMNVLVRCDKSAMIFGQQTYYCWFQCYDTTVAYMPEPLSIPGRTTDTLSFHSYLYPLSTPGTSNIRYTFSDQNNPSDSISATIVYDVLNTGVDEIVNNGSLATASPNPANYMTGIGYNLPSLNNPHLVIYNMLGSKVKDIEITSKQSLLLVSTSELESGIYVYSLVNNGKPVATKKLIVAHR